MTAEEMKAAIATSNTNTNTNTFVPREKLSITETIEFKSLLRLEFETNKTAIALKGEFESNGKKIEYGILPINTTIPTEYVGKKPAASVFLTSKGVVFGKVTSIGSDSINYIPVNLQQVHLDDLGTF